MGDERDFVAYVEARLPALVRSAYLLTGRQQDAEDLAQATLVKAIPVWGRISGNPDAYIRRIMVNESISRWRRRPARERLVEAPPEPLDPGPATELGLDLRRALAQLAPRQRAVVVLRYYEDLTEREVADILGVSVGTVKSQARDALARLRSLVPGLTLTG